MKRAGGDGHNGSGSSHKGGGGGGAAGKTANGVDGDSSQNGGAGDGGTVNHGGAGGSFSSANDGNPGGNGTEYDSTHGSGGGGGGTAGSSGKDGGDGGSYGGGGGGSRSGSGGAGASGLIIITYTPVLLNQTITFGALANKTYGDSDFSVSATGGASGNPVTFTASGNCTVSGTTVHITAAGSCTITANQAGNGSYNAASPVSQSFNIAQKALTITANSTSKTYGDTVTFAGTEFTNGALVAGDSITSVSLSSTGAAANAPVSGSPYTIVDSNAVGTGLSNYNINYVTGQLTVNPENITITADAKSKTYGDSDPALTYSVTSGNLVGADMPTGALTRDPGENVGNYNITQGTLALTSDYNLTYVPAQLTIGMGPVLTVTADNQTITYGQPDPTFSFGITGFVVPDDQSVIDHLPTCSVAGAHTDVNNYSITCSGASDNDYTFSYISGTLTVDQATTNTTITNSAALSSTDSNVGDAYEVDWSVTSSGGTPTGSVTVSDGTDSCTGNVSDGSCDLTSTTGGGKTITATYNGDANFSGSDDTADHYVNTPPVLATIPDQSVTEGDTATFTASATDVDGDTVAYGLGTLPVGINNAPTIDSTSGDFSWDTTGTTPADYIFNITADDGHGGTDATTTTITVSAVPVVTHTLTYTAGSNGSITGTSLQTVADGFDGSAVTAVADSGFHFVNWSDNSTDNPRTDTNVTSDISVTANFAADSNGGGGGGGGGGSNGPISTIVPSNGIVLGTSTEATGGEVLGTTTCSTLLITQIPMGQKYSNDPAQVKLLQGFLNGEMASGLPVSGVFGPLTTAAVKAFQLKYWQDILAPWVPYGLQSDHTPTGIVYKTTAREINNLYCTALDLPIPNLP